MRPEKLFLILSAVVLLIVVTVYFVRSWGDPSEPKALMEVSPAPSAAEIVDREPGRPDAASGGTATGESEVVVETKLAASDELVRRLAAGLSSRPEFASFLVPEGLIRRFVSSVQAVAGGYAPRDELSFMKASERFVVQRSGEELVIAPSSFRRYRLATEVFVSCDTDGLVQLYTRLKPLIEQAHRELPWHRSDFENTLLEAIDHLLRTPELDGPIAVERQTVTYAFADPSLEGLSDAQRLLLRLGPDNARKIQAKLEELRDALFPEETPIRHDGVEPRAQRAELRVPDRDVVVYLDP